MSAAQYHPTLGLNYRLQIDGHYYVYDSYLDAWVNAAWPDDTLAGEEIHRRTWEAPVRLEVSGQPGHFSLTPSPSGSRERVGHLPQNYLSSCPFPAESKEEGALEAALEVPCICPADSPQTPDRGTSGQVPGQSRGTSWGAL